MPDVPSPFKPADWTLRRLLLAWVLGCTFVYAGLFGAGSFLYGRTGLGTVWVSLLVASGLGLARLLPRIWARC